MRFLIATFVIMFMGLGYLSAGDRHERKAQDRWHEVQADHQWQACQAMKPVTVIKPAGGEVQQEKPQPQPQSAPSQEVMQSASCSSGSCGSSSSGLFRRRR